MNAPVRAALLAALTLALLAPAAAVAADDGDEAEAAAPAAAAPAAKPFSHKLHVEEQEMECQSCHDTKKPGLPTLKTKGCGMCHDDGPPPYKGPSKRPLDVKFPHQAHAELECATCHQDVLEDQHADTAPLVEPVRCFECHQAMKVKVPQNACARCHGEDKRREAPLDHGDAWMQRHGETSRWRVWGEHGTACTDCHQPATCKSCHMTEEPRDHNGLWRVRTHGLAAEWNRDRCMTCHETNICVRCHTDTKPVNHTAGWRKRHGLVAGTKVNQTCNVCHQPGYCAQCHAR